MLMRHLRKEKNMAGMGMVVQKGQVLTSQPNPHTHNLCSARK